MQAIKVNATGLAYTGHAAVLGVTLVSGAGAASTLTLDDSLDGLGTAKGGAKAAAASSQDAQMYATSFTTGVYATLSGSGAVAYIYIE